MVMFSMPGRPSKHHNYRVSRFFAACSGDFLSSTIINKLPIMLMTANTPIGASVDMKKSDEPSELIAMVAASARLSDTLCDCAGAGTAPAPLA